MNKLITAILAAGYLCVPFVAHSQTQDPDSVDEPNASEIANRARAEALVRQDLEHRARVLSLERSIAEKEKQVALDEMALKSESVANERLKAKLELEQLKRDLEAANQAGVDGDGLDTSGMSRQEVESLLAGQRAEMERHIAALRGAGGQAGSGLLEAPGGSDLTVIGVVGGERALFRNGTGGVLIGSVGDTIEGVKIVSIDLDGVDIEVDRQKSRLALTN